MHCSMKTKCGIEHGIEESEGDKYVELDLSSENEIPTEPLPTEQEPAEPAPVEQPIR